MALYTEKAVKNLIEKRGLDRSSYTGLYYIDDNNQKRYIVLEKQGGNMDGHTTNPQGQERKLVRRTKGWWPESKKIEAATLHVAVGNMVQVSKLTKIPLPTLRNWSEEPWWSSIQQRVKREANEETDSKFSKVVDKALDKLQVAIEKGDYIYDIKKGELANIPMTGRDLATVAGIVFDKRQLLRGEATKITKSSTDTEQHLRALAEKFAQLVKSKEEKVIPTEEYYAVQEQAADEVSVQPETQDGRQMAEGTPSAESQEAAK